MKRSMFGVLAAGAMATVLGTPALADSHAEKGASDAKACYRPQCGKSVKGYEGKCGGTKVDALTDQKSCETAGGAWATAADAEKMKHQ